MDNEQPKCFTKNDSHILIASNQSHSHLNEFSSKPASSKIEILQVPSFIRVHQYDAFVLVSSRE